MQDEISQGIVTVAILSDYLVQILSNDRSFYHSFATCNNICNLERVLRSCATPRISCKYLQWAELNTQVAEQPKSACSFLFSLFSLFVVCVELRGDSNRLNTVMVNVIGISLECQTNVTLRECNFENANKVLSYQSPKMSNSHKLCLWIWKLWISWYFRCSRRELNDVFPYLEFWRYSRVLS